MRAILNLLMGTLIVLLLVPDASTNQTTTYASDVPKTSTNTSDTENTSDTNTTPTSPSTQTQSDSTSLQPSSQHSAASPSATSTDPKPATPTTISTITTTTIITTTTRPKTSAPSGIKHYQIVILVILMVIIAVALLVLCIHKVVTIRRAGPDNTVDRLLLGVRERARAAVGALEGRLGFRLCPGGGVEEEEEEEEEGHGEGEDVEAGLGGERDGGEIAGDSDESDSSDDYSSLEGIGLRERVEIKEKEGKEEEEKGSDVSEAGPGESTVTDKDGGVEEGAEESAPMINSLPENNEGESHLSDITVL